MAIPWYSDSLPLRTHCGGVWVSIGEEEGERGKRRRGVREEERGKGEKKGRGKGGGGGGGK